MSKMSNEEMYEALEDMIDASSVSAVLEALAIVCHDKADHITPNWQDSDLALQWGKVAARVGKLADAIAANVTPGIGAK